MQRNNKDLNTTAIFKFKQSIKFSTTSSDSILQRFINSMQATNIKTVYIQSANSDEALEWTSTNTSLLIAALREYPSLSYLNINLTGFTITNLTHLDLSNNSSQMFAINHLANVLHLLPELEHLVLQNMNIDELSLRYLITLWRKYKLKISELSISDNKINDPSVADIYKLIDGNTYLKRLHMDSCELNDSFLKVLLPLLSDRRQCHIEYFSISKRQMISEIMYNALRVAILNHGNIELIPHIYIIGLNETNARHRRKNNMRSQLRLQQLFINQSIELANAYYSYGNLSSNKANLSKLPIDIINIILNMLWSTHSIIGMRAISIALCHRLIFNNFAKRRELKNQAKQQLYTATSKNSNPDEWWSKSITDDTQKNKIIFQKMSKDTLFYIEPRYREPRKPQLLPETKCILM